MSILRTLLLVVPLTIAPKIFHQIAFPRAGNAFWSHPLLLLLIKALAHFRRRQKASQYGSVVRDDAWCPDDVQLFG